MADSLVSVIIPVYNGERFVGNAVESVLCQSYRSYEVIVVNDGSTDNTLKVLERYGDQIQIVTQEHRGTPSASRNTGIKASTGDYVAFLDCDDLWHEDKLKIQIELLQEHRDILLCFSDFNRFEWEDQNFYALSHSQLNPVIYEVIRRKSFQETKAFAISKAEMFFLLLRRYWVSPSTMVCRRDLFQLIGSWDENLRTNEDWDFSLRATRVCDFLYVDERLADIGRHDTNLSKDILKQDEGNIAVLDLHMRSPHYTKDEKNLLCDSKGKFLCGLAYNYLEQRAFSKARRKYLEALMIPSSSLRALIRLPFTIPFIHQLKDRSVAQYDRLSKTPGAR